MILCILLHRRAVGGGWLDDGSGHASARTRYVVQLVGAVSTYYGGGRKNGIGKRGGAGKTDCPDGLKPDVWTEFYKRENAAPGIPEAEATKLMKDFPGNPGKPEANISRSWGRAATKDEGPMSTPIRVVL